MTIPEFAQLKDFIDSQIIGLSAEEALSTKKQILKEAGVFLKEYTVLEKLMQDSVEVKFSQEKQSILDELDTKLADFSKKIDNRKPNIVNKIVRERTIVEPQTIIESYDASPLLSQLENISRRIDGLTVPQEAPDVNSMLEEFKKEVRLDFGAMFKKNTDMLGMPDFRRLAMGLQGQIDSLRGVSLPSQTGNSGKFLTTNGTTTSWGTPSSGSGDVVGPSSSVDNALAVFDGVTGKLIKDSGSTLIKGTQSSILTLKAPTSDPQEATFTTMLDLGSGNKEFVDWTIENYGTDHIASINVSKSGTGTLLPLSIRFWNQDLGDVAAHGVKTVTFLSTGEVGIGTSAPTELLHLSKTTGNFTTIRYDSGTTQGYFFAYDGDNSVNIGSNSNSTVNFKVNNLTKASLDVNSNLTATTFTGALVGNASTVTNGVYTTGAGTVFLAPNGSAALLTSFPTLNQNTTGSAATLTTPRSIYGNNFDGSAALVQVIASTFGGTGNGFTKFSGPTTSEKTKTLRDATDTILELGGSYTPSGTWTSLTMVTPVLGTPTSGNLANCTFPTLNQNTTGSAAKLTTARTIAGVSFDGSANIAIASTNLSDTSSIVLLTSTQTLTNKRVTKRTGTTTSSATPTINTDNVDFYSLTAQTADITSFTTNLSGSPTENQTLWIAITGTAARAITWGTSFEASTVALPTTTVSTNRLDVGFVWNTVSSKWRCIASA